VVAHVFLFSYAGYSHEAVDGLVIINASKDFKTQAVIKHTTKDNLSSCHLIAHEKVVNQNTTFIMHAMQFIHLYVSCICNITCTTLITQLLVNNTWWMCCGDCTNLRFFRVASSWTFLQGRFHHLMITTRRHTMSAVCSHHY